MARERRYKVSNEIGAGSFATVFAATDTKLNREVAIKQLHKQFLADKEQMERYWQEAQLLGSLEHPNVMTIFDVVKKQGCLVLERMQGTLKDIYGERPMPVEDVRQVILQAAAGLKCLHENGIVHGDIKPGNLFLSKQEIVKLGDFGLARRVNDDDGSLIKGTTRYMAPELVSEEFGDVGPPSDLYSLGFSALEMMVGPQFETLFPDLIAFGRDRQMAWMMWHCSADRRLPPVQSLLAGVPEDLAGVIQKLTAKNQNERYTSAKEVIADLSGTAAPVGQSVKDQEAAEAEELRKKKKKHRIIAATACLLSVIACCALIFWPEKKEEVEQVVQPDIVGVVQNVLPLDNKLVLDLGTDWKELTLDEGDRIRLNRDERQLSNLQLGDRVVVHYKFDENGKKLYDIVAFRPETHTGVISKVDKEANQFVLTVSEGEKTGTEFLLTADDEMQVKINRLEEIGDNPFSFQSLAEGDRVIVEHSDDEQGMLALNVDALRDETLSGIVRKIDNRQQTISVDLPETEEGPSVVHIPVKSDCVFQINGQTSLNQELIQLADIQPGDKVTLEYDVEVKTIDAYREYSSAGTIVEIDLKSRTFSIKESTGKIARYSLPDSLKFSYPNEKLDLADVRVGDRVVSLSHDSPGSSAPPVDEISATRPVDRNKWALLIANETFEDGSIRKLTGSLANVKQIRDAMVNRYAVPDNQILVCNDFNQVRITQEVADWIQKTPANAEFYVYVATPAYSIAGQNVYLAAQDSKYAKMDENPFTLNWLIDLLDQCETKQKLLLLDCSPGDTSKDPQQVSSASEMIEIARSVRRGGYPRSVFVLGSCGEDQVGAIGEGGQSNFATVIAKGFTGEADLANDNKLEITELADFVQKQVIALNGSQNPPLFLPDPSPPRISQRAKEGILDLLSKFTENKLDLTEVTRLASQVDEQANGEPEPMTAYGVLLIKSTKMDQALSVFNSVRFKHPSFLPAHRGAIWLNYYKNRYDEGFTKLTAMLDHIPTPEELEEPYNEETLAIFEWAGQLRELAESAEWNKRLPPSTELSTFDETIQRFGEQPLARVQAGRQRVQEVIAGFAQEIAANPDSNARLKRSRLRSYVGSIANEEMINSIKSGLDR